MDEGKRGGGKRGEGKVGVFKRGGCLMAWSGGMLSWVNGWRRGFVILF